MIDQTKQSPTGKRTALNFTAGAVRSTLEDLIKILKREQIWCGGYTITGSETFVLTITVLVEDAPRVEALALQTGLYVGKTAKSLRIRPADREESGQEGGDTEMAKKAKKAKATGTATKQRSKEEYRQDPAYFECKTCKHFVLKDKKERHFDKHPGCRSQQPKEGTKKASVKKATAKKATKKAAKKPAEAAATTE